MLSKLVFNEYNIYVQLIKLNNSLEKVANTSFIIFDVFFLNPLLNVLHLIY